MSPAMHSFCEFYQALGAQHIPELGDVYAEDVQFCDPAHQIDGVSDLERYFHKLMADLKTCDFIIEDLMEQQGTAYVRWEMHFRHPRLVGGREIQVSGISHLKFNDKVYYHRDYFDLGAMLYEQLPLLGKVIRWLKGRLGR